jgi:hypothetical protein
VLPPREGAMIDFEVSGSGIVYLFRPMTPVACDWVDEHLPDASIRWCGAVIVQHHCIGSIVVDAIVYGFMVR